MLEFTPEQQKIITSKLLGKVLIGPRIRPLLLERVVKGDKGTLQFIGKEWYGKWEIGLDPIPSLDFVAALTGIGGVVPDGVLPAGVMNDVAEKGSEESLELALWTLRWWATYANALARTPGRWKVVDSENDDGK